MARKRRSSKDKKSQLPMILGGAGGVGLLAVAAAIIMKPSETQTLAQDSRLSVADYRQDASRLTGNSYDLLKCVIRLPGNRAHKIPGPEKSEKTDSECLRSVYDIMSDECRFSAHYVSPYFVKRISSIIVIAVSA